MAKRQKLQHDNNSFEHRIFQAIEQNNYGTFVELLGNNDDEKRENTMRKVTNPVSQYNEYLLELCVDNTPFLICALYCRYEMLEYMLQIPNIDVNQQDREGNNALSSIIISAHTGDVAIKCVKLLLSHPLFNVNAVTIGDRTVLMLVVQNECHFNMFKMLLKHGNIDINIQSNSGNTALMSAASRNCKTVRFLLHQPNIQINLTNNKGETALYQSAHYIENGIQCQRQLLNRSDVNIHYIVNEATKSLVANGIDNKMYISHALLIHGRL
jgi:ankyrin repeat protein